jgi:predicted nucleic acid-binding protein
MASTRRTAPPSPQRLILDSGAVIAFSKGDLRVRSLLRRSAELGVRFGIPAVVVAETLRGGPRDAIVHRLLKLVDAVESTAEDHGRMAGLLLGLTKSSSTIDALVVAHAILGGGGEILTGDPDDLTQLAAAHPEVTIRAV